MGKAVGYMKTNLGAMFKPVVSVIALLCLSVCLVAFGGLSSQVRGDDAHTLEGSWDIVITTTPNPPFQIPFRILRTVTRVGVVDAYAFPSITPTPGALINSGGHGSWMKIGPRLYSATVEYFQLNPSAPLDKLDTVGKVRENIEISKDGNSYISTFETTISLPDGTEIIHNAGRTEGKRITVEPLAYNP